MSLQAMREAEEAVPVFKAADTEDRLVTAADPADEPYVRVTAYYDTCMSSGQLADVRGTEGLQLHSVHPGDGSGVRAHFHYYPEGGDA